MEFQEGDRVRIVKAVPNCAVGWVDRMTKRVDDGNIYTIQKSGEDCYMLQECSFWWPAEALELAQKEPGNYLIHVPTESLSEAVQERLFALGYRWVGSGKTEVQFTSEPYLYIASNGKIRWGSRSMGETGGKYDEITLDELFSDDFSAYKEEPEIMIAGEPVEEIAGRIEIYYKELKPEWIIRIYAALKRIENYYSESVSITVGCETIPLEKIQQIVERYCE